MWPYDMFTYDKVTYDNIDYIIWQATIYDNDISLRTSIRFPWILINGKIILYLTSSSITRLALLNLYCNIIYDQWAYYTWRSNMVVENNPILKFRHICYHVYKASLLDALICDYSCLCQTFMCTYAASYLFFE